MSAMQKLIYIWTKDDLRLQGVHYLPSKTTDVCVLVVHGMSGNILENYWAHVLGEKLSENGTGCLFGHNRGYNHINDIATKELSENGGYSTRRFGATYERFEECLFDIEAWVSECRKLGYKKLVLLGHSLGCNKTIYYLSKKKSEDVVGVVLASPPDMVAMFEKKEYQPDHKELLKEARENVKKGYPRKWVSNLIWDWYHLSSQTYAEQSVSGKSGDNLPVMRNPEKFEQLASISVPILGIMGENDDIAVKTLKEDLDLISSKAIGAPSFTMKFVKGANHTYDRVEDGFAKIVLDWIMGLK